MKQQIYKSTGKKGLFDEQETIQKLAMIGNPLDKIIDVVDFEMFRLLLESKLLNMNKKEQCWG
jgi:hypothetical protein